MKVEQGRASSVVELRRSTNWLHLENSAEVDREMLVDGQVARMRGENFGEWRVWALNSVE